MSSIQKQIRREMILYDKYMPGLTRLVGWLPCSCNGHVVSVQNSVSASEYLVPCMQVL